MNRQLKKELGPMLKPHYNIADSIPISNISEEGVFETRKGLFSKTYRLQDCNFSVAQRVEKGEMFMQYESFLNAMDPSQMLQITIYNHHISGTTDADSVLLPEVGDGYDDLRSAFNKIVIKNAEVGNSGIRKEKFFTLSQEAQNMLAAEKAFTLAESELLTGISAIPGADLKALDLFERLNLLKDIYTPGKSGGFSEYAYIAGKKVKAFSIETMYEQGMSAREIIAPESMEFRPKWFKFGDKFGRALDLSHLPGAIKDSFLNDMTNTDFDMILSMNIKMYEKDEGYKLVQRKLNNAEAQFMDGKLVSYTTRRNQEELVELMDDITKRDSALFDVRIHIAVFADTLELLNEYTDKIRTLARSRGVGFSTATDMQEQALCAAMPFGFDPTATTRTLNSDGTAGFIPFSAQELQAKRTKNSIPGYWGINRTTKNIISYDRYLGDSYNAMIWGFTGSGKSMTAKSHIANVFLADPEAEILIIDPQGEYAPLCNALDGQVVNLIGSGKQRLNPLDIERGYGSDDADPVASKIDFLSSMVQVMIGQSIPLTAIQRNAIIMAGKRVYENWLRNDKRDEYVPTLQDFYEALESREDVNKVVDIYELCMTVQRFTKDGVDVIFSDRTNIDLSKRVIDFSISDLGEDLKPLAMLILLDHVWNRTCRNRKLNRRTYIFIDEVHLLMKSPMVANYLQKFYKVMRKLGGAPCSITQNVEDLINSEAGRGIINNTPFIVILKQSQMDRSALAQLFNLSDTQLSYITNTKPGEGLLYVQGSQNMDNTAIIPFRNIIPDNNPIFKLITTKMEKEED